MRKLWVYVVQAVGGMHGVGWSRLWLCIHDRGVIVAWDQVIRWQWRF